MHEEYVNVDTCGSSALLIISIFSDQSPNKMIGMLYILIENSKRLKINEIVEGDTSQL